MPSHHHIGNNVGLIYDFHFRYPGNGVSDTEREALRDTDALLKDTKAPNLIAITADTYQSSSRAPLKSHGFTPILTFKSAHNHPDEVLTFWVRHDTDAPPYKAKAQRYDYNCSVGINDDIYHRLQIKTTRPRGPKLSCYRKVPRMPVWYKVAKRYLVKTAE